MKRILSLFIALVLILSTLASCNLFPQKVEETDISEAVKELNDMYAEKFNGKSIPNGEELIAQLTLGTTKFTIEWTTNNDKITISLVDGLCVVNIPNDIEESVEYKLIGTITTEGGQNAQVEYNLILVTSYGMITSPVAGKAYKFALLHGNEKAVVYFDGGNYNNYAWYLSYTTDALAAVDVYLEEVEGVEGGYRLYFNKDGVKTYIVAFPRDGDTTKGTLKLDSAVPTEYYTFSTEHNTLIYTSVTGEQFYIGSSGTYKSISCSEISYLNSPTSYPVRLYGAGGVEEKLPEQQLPTVPENYTSEDVVEALYKLESGQTLDGPYLLTGIVTSIKYEYDPAYGNVSVNIVVGNLTDKPVLLYRIKGEGADTVKVGDTITVRAGITNYNGTYETVSGGFIEALVPGEGGDEPVTPPVGGEDDVIVLDLTGNANLVSGSADQNVFAANGITLTNDKSSSTSDLTVQATYAQRFYVGSKIKIEYTGMTKIVLTLDDYSDGKYLKGFDGMTVEGATITRENDVVTIVFDAPVNEFVSAEFASQVRCEKLEVYTGEVEGGNQGGTDEPVTPPAPTYTAPVAGTAYDLYMQLPTGKVYFAGSMSGDYLATTTDSAAAVAIYFEEVTGGYHIYFMDGETKTYITAAAYLKSNGYAGCHFSLTTNTPTLAWTYDTTYGIIEIYDEIDGKSDTFFAGTYGTYNTVSLSGAYYKDQIASGSQYPARIEAIEGGEVVPPVGGDTPVDPPHEHSYVDGKCSCGAEDPNYQPPSEGPITSISAALTAAQGAEVVLTGTVTGFYEVWSSYNNCSPYIEDAEGNKILVFRTTTKVALGDVITVTGTIGAYNNVNQVAQGNTVVIDVPHVCSEFTEATCLNAATCIVCGEASGKPLDHVYVDGKCSCGAVEGVATVTASKTIAELITALGWTSSTTKQTFSLDDVVTVAINGGNNTGKAYNGDHIRIYATDTPAGTLTISVAEGYELVSVKISTQVGTYAFLYVDGTTTDICNETVSVSGSSVLINSVKNGADGKQARVTAIEVVYRAK